jgi:hypothetical protein
VVLKIPLPKEAEENYRWHTFKEEFEKYIADF